MNVYKIYGKVLSVNDLSHMAGSTMEAVYALPNCHTALPMCFDISWVRG